MAKSLRIGFWTGIVCVILLCAVPSAQSQTKFTDQEDEPFMEETTPSQPADKPKPKMNTVDITNLGVQVDQNGRIVPLLNQNGGPVQQQGSSIEYSREFIYTPQSTYYPGLVPVPAGRYYPNGSGIPFGLYPGYGSPYGLYPGNYPYAPYAAPGVNLNLRLGRGGGINLSTGAANPYFYNNFNTGFYGVPPVTQSWQYGSLSPFFNSPIPVPGF